MNSIDSPKPFIPLAESLRPSTLHSLALLYEFLFFSILINKNVCLCPQLLQHGLKDFLLLDLL
jgi:hypothetical protein